MQERLHLIALIVYTLTRQNTISTKTVDSPILDLSLDQQTVQAGQRWDKLVMKLVVVL